MIGSSFLVDRAAALRSAGTDTAGPAGALLGWRLQALSITRAIAVVALTVVLLYGEARSLPALLWISAARLLLDATCLVAVRNSPSRTPDLLLVTLVADAVWATVIIWAAGGLSSSMVLVLQLLVVAVTVLFGAWAGVQLAALGTLSVLWVAVAGAGDGLAALVRAPVDLVTVPDQAWSSIGTRAVAREVMTIWALVAVAALFSHLNDRDLRRSNRELVVLRELSAQLESSLETTEVSQAIARGTVRDLGYSRAIVWIPERSGELVAVGVDGFRGDAGDTLKDVRLSLTPGPVADAIQQSSIRVLRPEDGRPAALVETFGLEGALVIVPLQTEGRLLGLLVASPRGPGREPRFRALRVLGTVATEASLALDNARMHAELRDLAVTDALTGLYNHRYFQQRLQEELDRSERAPDLDGFPSPVSLIFVDLDEFKTVNDRYGHPAGDELLRDFAQLARLVTRSSDVVCRYGGEEFGVILPETSPEQADQVANRLREAIERSQFVGTDGRHLGRVTASFGVATSRDGSRSRAKLISYADDALYEAKRGGRNRVVLSRVLRLPSIEEAGRSSA